MLAPTKTSAGTYVRTAIAMECPCSSRAAPCSSRAAQSATTYMPPHAPRYAAPPLPAAYMPLPGAYMPLPGAYMPLPGRRRRRDEPAPR